MASRVGSCRISPSWVTHDPATISSLKSGAKRAALVLGLLGHQRHQVDDVLGVEPRRRPGHLAGHVPPAPHLRVADPHQAAGHRPSTFPPESAARSTTTEPGFICSTISAVTSIGAWRPGTAAVVISASAAAMYGASSSRWRAARSSVISRAYPPAPRASPAPARSPPHPSSGSPLPRPRARRTPSRPPQPPRGRDRLRPATPAPRTTTSGRRDGARRGHVQREERRSRPAATIAQR